MQKRRLIQAISQAIFNLVGWRVEGQLPDVPRYVLIAVPHTTNWDFILLLLFIGIKNIRPRWVGKESLFRGPAGPLMRWLGGVSINRQARTNMVSQSIDAFNTHDEFIIILTPEGTRSHTEYWRSGFYYIALGAGVPVVPVSDDYPDKVLRIGDAITLSGDTEADMALFREVYAGKRGKYPRQQGEIRLKPRPPDITDLDAPSPKN